MAQRFERLLSPGTMGKLSVKNRVVMPPMVRNFATTDGMATRQLIDHYAAHAKGGVGMAIVEATYVEPAGKGFHQQLGIHHDKCIPGLNHLAEAVKEWGARIAIQLHHAGRQTNAELTGEAVVAPSAIPCPISGGLPRELATEEVMGLVEAFAQSARRAKAAGFDGVEIHAAHGYIVSAFLSPNTNRRTDKYGGDLDGRMSFLLEIIARTKDLAGADYPIIVRINAEDFVACGLGLEDCRMVAQRVQAAGADCLHVSGGTYECLLNPRVTSPFGMASMYAARGQLITDAQEVKKAVVLPVIAVGAITAEMGEQALVEEKADFIAFGRQQLTDPELVNKLARGEPESVRPCIRCNEMCIGRLFDGLGIRCTVNAELGVEGYGLRPAPCAKKVLVAGGGPAGMEGARVAALRGHDVTLCEKSDRLGGHLLEATIPDFKDDLRSYRDWLIRQMEKSGVKIEMGREVTRQMVGETRPDVVIVASGSTMYRPAIAGIDKPIVATAIDVLLGREGVGNRTIIAGGGAIGCELALHLARHGKEVSIVEMLPEVATDVPTMSKGALITELMDHSVEMLTNYRIIEVTDSGVIAIDRGQHVLDLDADRVVLAIGLVPDKALYEQLKGSAREVYVAGDCVEPRRVGEATREGYVIGSTI